MAHFTKARDKWIVLGLLGFYLVSLCLPAVYSRGGNGFFSGGNEAMFGIHCVAMIPVVLIAVPWWANPLFLLGLVSLAVGSRRVTFWLGCVGLSLALCSVFYFPWTTQTGDTGAVKYTFGPAYYLWIMCLIGLVTSAFLPRFEGSEAPDPNIPSGQKLDTLAR